MSNRNSGACWKKRQFASIVTRLAHTCLVVGVASTLMVKDTVLHQSITNGTAVYAAAYGTLVICSLLFYHTTCVINPGYVSITRKNPAWEDSDDENEEEKVEQENVDDEETGAMISPKPRLRRCGFCGIKQPLRARHCEECDRCVLKFDHHCPWLQTCIGERNHRFFWMFLLTTAALIGWSLYITWDGFIPSTHVQNWLNSNILFLVDIVILVIGGVVVMSLLGFHTYLMLINSTTWEQMSRSRITYLKNLSSDFNPFYEGTCINVCKFLFYCKDNNWEVTYVKKLDSVHINMG